jgi:diguanylate cyclase (GGDEF)-like protein/PAS domain S-box-containing protein
VTVVLAEAVDSLQKCLEVLTDPCVVFDPVRDAEGEVVDLRCVFVNAAAEELCQRRAAQLVGRTVLSLYPSVTGSGVLACSTEPFRTGRPCELHVSAIDVGAIDGTFDVVAGLFGDHVLVTAHNTLMQASDRPIADDPGEFVFLSDSAGRIEWVSPSVRAVVGWSPSELVGREAREFMPRADAHLPGAEDLLADGPAPGPRRHRFLTRSGAYRWLTTTDHEIRDSRGAVTATVSGVRDAQAEVEPEQAQAEVDAEQAQAAAETRFRLIAENASDAVVVTGEGGRIEWVSPGVETVLGWDQAALIGLHLIDLLSPDDPHRAGHHRKRLFEGVVAEPVLGRFRTASGGSRWMSGSARPIAGTGGDVTGSVIGLRDVDIDVQSNAALRESEALFRTAMNSAAIGMAIYDTDFRFRVVNPAFCELVQRDEAWLLTHQCRDVIHPDDEMGAWREFTRLAAGDDASCISHLRFVRADGSIRKARVAVVLIRDSDGAPDFALGQIEDITAETNARDALAYQAFHDSLTGLRNRPRIMELLDTDLRAAGRNRGQVGVLFIDLDNFKVVNDSLGHVAGDEVLTIIAGRVSAAVRPGDRVGRFGGDEFVVVTPGIEEHREMEAIASRISAAIATELNVQGHRIVPTASVGIAISGPGSTSTSLMRDADSALFRAKATGRSRWQFFEVDMHAQANRRLTTEHELRRALDRREIVVHYQPIAHWPTDPSRGTRRSCGGITRRRDFSPPTPSCPPPRNPASSARSTHRSWSRCVG